MEFFSIFTDWKFIIKKTKEYLPLYFYNKTWTIQLALKHNAKTHINRHKHMCICVCVCVCVCAYVCVCVCVWTRTDKMKFMSLYFNV